MEPTETPPLWMHSRKGTVFFWIVFLGAPALTVILAQLKKPEWDSVGLLAIQPLSSLYCAYVVPSTRYTGLSRVLVALLLSPLIWVAETILAFAGCASIN